MSKPLMLLIVLFLFFTTAQAQQLLPSCEEVVGDESYKPLKDYLVQDQSAVDCQQLNSHEFLYTTDRQIYYCNFRLSSTAPCEEDSMGVWYPGLDLVARFTGPNGKRFVLLYTQQMKGGIFDSGYQLIYMVPKHVSPRGYIIMSLEGIGEHNGESSDDGETCGGLSDDEEAIKGAKYQILNEGKKDVAVVFNQTVVSCKTGHMKARRIEYRWEKDKFVRTESSGSNTGQTTFK